MCPPLLQHVYFTEIKYENDRAYKEIRNFAMCCLTLPEPIYACHLAETPEGLACHLAETPKGLMRTTVKTRVTRRSRFFASFEPYQYPEDALPGLCDGSGAGGFVPCGKFASEHLSQKVYQDRSEPRVRS